MLQDDLQLIRKRIGPALLKLDELEKQMMEQKDDLQQMEQAVGELITVM